MKVLILDNFDSFTYNLYHYVQYYTDDIMVARNDEIGVEDAEEFTHIIISPGPGLPDDAGISKELISRYYRNKSILGVCLGCQAIAEIFGGHLYNQNEVAHGVERKVIRSDRESWLLQDLPGTFKVGLYHSWAIDPEEMAPEIRITAHSEKGILMALEHKELPLAGVQFHPESVMSEHGLQIVRNWLYCSNLMQ